MTGWSAYLYYARLFAWPNALTIDRLDYPVVQSFIEFQAWGSLLVLMAMAGIAGALRRRAPAVTIGILWILVTLAAESSVFPLAEPVNEHRPYLALLGFATVVVVLARGVVGQVARWAQVPAVATTVVVGVAACVALGAAARERNVVWQSDYALWREATERAPQNTRAWTNAGHAALVLGRLDEAGTLLREGQRLAPCYSYALLNLSALERRQGDVPAALDWAERAVACRPDSGMAHEYHGAALLAAARPAEALTAYETAVARDPRNVEAWFQAARLYEAVERWPAAATAYDTVVRLDPARIEAAMGAAVIHHHRLGDSARAVALYDRVLAEQPTHYGAHYQRAVALLALGRTDEAYVAWAGFRALAEAIDDRATLAAAPAAFRTASAAGGTP
jgi:protein O-mannosyl-transferase